MSQSQALPTTTPDRLREVIAETIQIDVQGLQAAIGQLVVASSSEYPEAPADSLSVRDAVAGATVLLADRIPLRQEVQFVAAEIERWFGREVVHEIFGDLGAEVIDNSGKVYALPDAKNVSNSWRLCNLRDFEPSDNQLIVIKAVRSALEAGLYYSNEIKEFCAKRIGLSDREIDANFEKSRVEGGIFGMECYYARDYISSQMAHQKEDATLRKLRPYVGMKIGALVFNDGKRNTGAFITGIEGNLISLQMKRGKYDATIAISAVGIERAVDRAAEMKFRKDDFSLFASDSLETNIDNGPSPGM